VQKINKNKKTLSKILKRVILLPDQDADKPQSEATPTRSIHFKQTLHFYTSIPSKPHIIIDLHHGP